VPICPVLLMLDCPKTYPLCDKTGCIELNCPQFSDRTGCKCCQVAGLLEVERAKPCRCDQGTLERTRVWRCWGSLASFGTRAASCTHRSHPEESCHAYATRHGGRGDARCGLRPRFSMRSSPCGGLKGLAALSCLWARVGDSPTLRLRPWTAFWPSRCPGRRGCRSRNRCRQ